MGRRASGFRVVPGRRRTDSYYVRFTHAGRRHYLSTGTRDPRIVSQRAAAIYTQVVSGRPAEHVALATKTSLDEWAARYLEYIEATGSKERYAMQRVHFRAHLLPAFTALRQLEDPGAWSDYLMRRGQAGVCGSTIAKELSTLRGFAAWCTDHHLIAGFPKIKAPKGRSGFRALHLQVEQIEAILGALPERVAKGPAHGRPIRARHIFAWETALRPATIARIRVEDYDRERKQVQIRDEIDKARFGRDLPLSTRAWQTLESVMPKAGLIFGTARAGATLKRAARAAGLPEHVAERFTSYTFRHSRISQLASASSDLRGIAHLAGHRNVNTTSRYVHGDVRAAKRVLEAAASAVESS